MAQFTSSEATRHVSPAASLAALGIHLRQIDLFGPIRAGVKIAQKTRRAANRHIALGVCCFIAEPALYCRRILACQDEFEFMGRAIARSIPRLISGWLAVCICGDNLSPSDRPQGDLLICCAFRRGLRRRRYIALKSSPAIP